MEKENVITELYRRQQGILDQLRMLDPDTKEYADLSKDLTMIQKVINDAEKNENDRLNIQENIRRNDLEYETKNKEIDAENRKTATGVITFLGGCAVTVVVAGLTFVYEQDNVVTGFVKTWIPKLVKFF